MTGKPRAPRSAGRAPSGPKLSRLASRGEGGPNSRPGGLEISNQQRSVRVTRDEIRRIVRAVLEAERVERATISVTLTDNATVRRVNREFLRHDYDTDVLSFLFESPRVAAREKTAGAARRGHGRHIDGEVLVSAEMAAERAGQFGWSGRDELTLYLIHGLLHLCGYDDQTPPERRVMRGRERTILADLGIGTARGIDSGGRVGRRALAKNGTRS